MKQVALIVAGGKGNRMNATVPKQFLILNNRPILMHTINRFLEYNSEMEVIVVLPESEIQNWKQLCKKYNFEAQHRVVAGGKERFFSVQNGLDQFTGNGLVFIHDGVRPLVSLETIQRCESVAEEKGNVIPVLPLIESIRKVSASKSEMAKRSDFVSIQTPQAFKIELIKKAYQQEFNSGFTDDASVLENLGIEINLVEGNRENIKITHETDLKIAKALFE